MARTYGVPLLACVSLLWCCGGSGAGGAHDLSVAEDGFNFGDGSLEPQPLTIYNTGARCTVTIGASGVGSSVLTSDDEVLLPLPVGTVVGLSALPNSGAGAVQWSGATTTDGASASYILTDAVGQSVTACCPMAGGGGC